MATSKLTPAYFVEDPTVQALVTDLKKQCGDICQHKHISDVYDQEGHPYVNLVQEGGGVLGIALVGYTYALESVGIRFLKLAGTSAGAINTILLATVVPNQQFPTKSEKILSYLAPKPLFDFVDAHWFPRWLIRSLIKTKNTLRNTRILGYSILVLLAIGPLFFWVLPLQWALFLLKISAISWVGTALIVFFGIYLWGKFKKNRWGIANGEEFRNWISNILKQEINGTTQASEVTVDDFESHVCKNARKDLWLSEHYIREMKLPTEQITDWGRSYIEDLVNPSFETNPGWVTFITSDITTKNKIELPRMWPLYRSKGKKNELFVADFVRASMSIPVFFRIHKITGIPAMNDDGSFETSEELEIRSNWESKTYLNYPLKKKIPAQVCLVDGGALSNFPINIFFNPNIAKPRLPTFGIRLGEDNEINQIFRSVTKYLGSLLNTVRYHYDKDFQVKHTEFMKTTAFLKVDQFNWLNFNLTDKEKLELFRVGVKAAYEFLLAADGKKLESKEPGSKGFNFADVQNERPAVLQKLEES